MESQTDLALLRAAVLSMPEIAAWPEVAGLFNGDGDQIRIDWQLPALACQAVGGDRAAAISAMAAIACLQISIILVDDMLDQDPRGEYLRSGNGRTANMALALQAASLALLAQAPAAPERRAAAALALSQAALATCYGQELDVQNLRGEANYWRVVQAKSTPFYGAALQTGALLGGASPDVAQKLYDCGVQFGQIIQIFDDLIDAFETPANPDWCEGRNNLALLFASSAEHPERERFLRLRERSADPSVLQEAQSILISSGAVSYCVFLLIQRHNAAKELIHGLNLPDPTPILHQAAQQMVPLVNWLQALGFPIPAELER